ncbi:MAG: hypothetical protein ACOZNI_17505 [Myxococcota bacterium]
MPVGYHLVFRLRDSRVIARDARTRRRLARSFLEIGDRFGLLGFGLAANHAHGEFVCDRAAAGDAAQAIGSSITQALGLPVGFNVTYVKPIEDQAHLESLFDYVHRQDAKHGVVTDPLRDGSSIPDLLGLRMLGTSLEERVVAHVPRATREALRRHLPVGPAVSVFAPHHLADSAAAVFALPDLRGNGPASVLARAAAVQIALPHLKTLAIAELLGCSRTTVNALREREVPDEVIRATKRGIALRAALGERLTPRLPPGPQATARPLATQTR